jgi:proton-translocating NADH-quinone oxidoreductase chain M
VGLDGISFFFVFLVPFLLLLCVISLSDYKNQFRELLLILYFIFFALINTFTVLDFFFFFFFLEFSVIPMFFLIGIWGSRTRRVVSSYTYYFFSFFASISMFVSIIYLYIHFDTTSLLFFNSRAFDINNLPLDEENIIVVERLLWLGIFFSLAVKMPIYPFHIWLPEAHGEASTVGSVVLAGLFLKMAGYGMIRFLIPIFPGASYYFQPYIFVVSLMGVFYCAMILFRQFDLKKFVAYSSVIHMNLTTIALFSFSNLAILGGLFSMLTHSIIASFLFFSVGIIYDRFHSRLVPYYSDLVERMPRFCLFFFTALVANCAFPFTVGFLSELLVFVAIGQQSISALILTVIAMGLTGIAHYSLISKLLYSHKNIEFFYINYFERIDLKLVEYQYLLPLFILVLGLTFFAHAYIIEWVSESAQIITIYRDLRLR